MQPRKLVDSLGRRRGQRHSLELRQFVFVAGRMIRQDLERNFEFLLVAANFVVELGVVQREAHIDGKRLEGGLVVGGEAARSFVYHLNDADYAASASRGCRPAATRTHFLRRKIGTQSRFRV